MSRDRNCSRTNKNIFQKILSINIIKCDSIISGRTCDEQTSRWLMAISDQYSSMGSEFTKSSPRSPAAQLLVKRPNRKSWAGQFRPVRLGGPCCPFCNRGPNALWSLTITKCGSHMRSMSSVSSKYMTRGIQNTVIQGYGRCLNQLHTVVNLVAYGV